MSMMKNLKFSSLIHLFIIVVTLSLTYALPLNERDVYAPPITYPTASTTWYVGSRYFVTWDTRNMPPYTKITNPSARLFIGYEDADGQHIDTVNPVAQYFDIRNGHVEVTVPNVPERENGYFLVLFGDSGDKSADFPILGGSSSQDEEDAESSDQ